MTDGIYQVREPIRLQAIISGRHRYSESIVKDPWVKVATLENKFNILKVDFVKMM